MKTRWNWNYVLLFFILIAFIIFMSKWAGGIRAAGQQPIKPHLIQVK